LQLNLTKVSLEYADGSVSEITLNGNIESGQSISALISSDTDALRAKASPIFTLADGSSKSCDYSSIACTISNDPSTGTLVKSLRTAIRRGGSGIILGGGNVVSDNLDRYSFNDIDNSLVGWWRMEDSGTTISDSSGRGNDGVVQGSGAQQTGKFGSSLSFGGNSYVDLGTYLSHPTLVLPKTITISAWIQGGSTGPILVAGNGDGLTNTEYYFAVKEVYGSTAGAVLVFNREGGSYGVQGYSTSVIPALSNPGWHHVVATISDTGILYFYVDGSRLSNDYFEGVPLRDLPPLNSNNIFIGHCNMCFTYFSDNLDEVLLFNRALGAEEIKSLYDAKANPLKARFVLASGNHTFQGFMVDASGKVMSTEVRNVVI